jgi:hypothetical protein
MKLPSDARKEENAKQRANPQPPTLDGNGGGHSPIPACPSHASSTDSIVTNVAAFSILVFTRAAMGHE